MIYFNIILIVLEILVSICFFYSPMGSLTFGYGLGDVFYLLCFNFALLTHLIWIIVLKIKRSQANTYRRPFIIYTIILLWVLYKVSFGRGPEFPWNHEIFISF